MVISAEILHHVNFNHVHTGPFTTGVLDVTDYPDCATVKLTVRPGQAAGYGGCTATIEEFNVDTLEWQPAGSVAVNQLEQKTLEVKPSEFELYRYTLSLSGVRFAFVKFELTQRES